MRVVEHFALLVLELLPKGKVERTRDVVQIEHVGRYDGIVLIVTKEALELRLPTVEWMCGAYAPAEASDLWKRVTWKKLKNKSSQIDKDKLAEYIETAKEERRKQFAECKYCKRKYPPESRISDDVCHGCATTYEGVVF